LESLTDGYEGTLEVSTRNKEYLLAGRIPVYEVTHLFVYHSQMDLSLPILNSQTVGIEQIEVVGPFVLQESLVDEYCLTEFLFVV